MHELQLPGPIPSPQGLPVEPDPETLLQLRDRVEEARGVAYHRLPEVHRQLLAVVAVELGPGPVHRPLGVDDQAVEVEDEGPDHPPILPPERQPSPLVGEGRVGAERDPPTAPA